MMDRPPRFHWQVEETSLEPALVLCRMAETGGLESLWPASGTGAPDPLLLALALGLECKRIPFTLSCRPGLLSPTALVQQVNTVSTLIGGRIRLALDCRFQPDELARYGVTVDSADFQVLTTEFLTVCHRFWQGGQPLDYPGRFYHIEGGRLGTPFQSATQTRPFLYLCGDSSQTADLTASMADILWLSAIDGNLANTFAKPLLPKGKHLGLRALLVPNATIHDGAPSPGTVLTGSPDEIASALVDFGRLGITDFCLTGRSGASDLDLFLGDILPRVLSRLGSSAASQGAMP